ncbi:MAG: hypothetical protein AAFX94_10065, partial [Myxococcota bacterium]
MVALLFILALGASDGDRQRAKREFQRGMDAAASSDYAKAQEHLRASHALYPTQATAFNLAVTERALGDYLASRTLLIELRENRYGKLPSGSAKEVSRWLEDVSKRLGTLLIELEGRGTVSVGTAQVEMTAGRGQLSVNPGTYSVKVTTEAGTLEQSVRVSPGAEQRVVFAAQEKLLEPPKVLATPEESEPHRRQALQPFPTTTVIGASCGVARILLEWRGPS